MFTVWRKRLAKFGDTLRIGIFEDDVEDVAAIATLAILLTRVPREAGVIEVSGALNIRVERMRVRLDGVTLVT